MNLSKMNLELCKVVIVMGSETCAGYGYAGVRVQVGFV